MFTFLGKQSLFQAPSTLPRRNLKTHQSAVSLDLCLRKTQTQMIIVMLSVSKSSVFKMFFPKAGGLNFLRFEERFVFGPD